MKFATAQLVMSNVSGSSFVGIDTETPVKLKGGRKNPFQNRVTKRVTGSNVMVFQNKNVNGYENMVKRRLEQEGKDPESFVLGKRVWGTRIENTPFVEYNDQFYLETIFLKSGEVEYLVDGKVTDPTEIEGLESASENEESQGGLDNKVIVRTIKVDNIKKLTISGKEFV